MTEREYTAIRIAEMWGLDEWKHRHESILRYLDLAWDIATKTGQRSVNRCRYSKEAINAIGGIMYRKDVYFLAEHGYRYIRHGHRIYKDGKVLSLITRR